MSAIIKVNQLTKQYAGATAPAVDQISFQVQAGEFFAFLGPNGAGKTTTIAMLTTMLNASSGQVTIAGHDLARDPQGVRNDIGIIFQKPTLDLQLTAEENLRFHACLHGMYPYHATYRGMPQSYKQRVQELATVVGLQDALFQPVKNMSGGMARKFEIMRSLMHNPKILFLDEPSTGLDAVSRRNLWTYIDTLRQRYGMTVFLTTHYIDEAQGADHVCIINHGRIVTFATPETLQSHLLQEQLILDSRDRPGLLQELDAMAVQYTVSDHVHVKLAGQGLSAQQIISNLHSTLTTFKLHSPSLEDAYIASLNESGVHDDKS